MEDDRVISRDDRLALDCALNDPERKDSVIALLLKIEVSKNTQFFQKRLKALIHQNPSGLPILGGGVHCLGTHPSHCLNLEQQLEPLLVNTLSSCSPLDRCKNVPRLLSEKIIPPYSNFLSSERLAHNERGQGQNLQTPFSPASIPSLADSPLISRRRSITNSTRRGSDNSYDKSVQYSFDEDLDHDNDYQYDDTKLEIGIKSSTTLRSLDGKMPLYSKQDYFGVCSKILTRYHEFNSSGIISKLPQFAVLVCSASCNPLTRMYLRSFYLARKHLEKSGYIVLGTILSPLHGINVREKYRNYPSEIIPSPHRLIVSQLMVQNDKFISIDPWEMSRKRAMDYLSVLQHCKEILHEVLPNIKTKIVYVCTDNVIPKISLNAIKKENFGCICVCRPVECDRAKNSLNSKWNGIIWIAEDKAIIDRSMDISSSREVRFNIKANKSVKHLVGNLIDSYFRYHRIGSKMNGEVEWSANDLKFPVLSNKLAPSVVSAPVLQTSTQVTRTGTRTILQSISCP